MSKLPFHLPSAVISPNNGLALKYCPCDCFGLNAACGWLLMLAIVEVDPNEVEVPNDVAGDFTGDAGLLF